MSLRPYLHIVITLVLMALTSQLLASATMTCAFDTTPASIDVENRTHNHHNDMLMNSTLTMDHQAHEYHSHTQSSFEHQSHASHHKHSASDCCKFMGSCLMGCALSVADKNTIFVVQKQTSIAIDFYSRNSTSPLPPSHYRPPIFS